MQAAREIYWKCLDPDLDSLPIDERPDVKFEDADRIEVPFRITAGKKLGSGVLEGVERRGRRTTDGPVAEPAAWVSRQC